MMSAAQFLLQIAWIGIAACVEGATPAFPGAAGFGADATGGRFSEVARVTNLNDSGTGSFRDAVSAANRVVVFAVSGYISLHSAVALHSNLTVLGSTAPGDGIGLMGAEVSLSGQSNIIIRGLRFRQGTLDPDKGRSALNLGDSSRIIIDSCSIEYGQWDSLDAVKAATFTVSNCIIAMPIGQQFGAHVEGGPATFLRNLWVSAHNRQPLAKANTQYINNVIYNYQAAYTAGNSAGAFLHDILGNYFVAGPSTPSNGSDAYFQMNSKQSAYAAGNMLDADRDGRLNGVPHDAAGDSTVLRAPWSPTSADLYTLSADGAYAWVLPHAGARPRDAVDKYAVDATASLGFSGSMYKDQNATGLPNNGYGVLSASAALPDSAGSGIPDWWAAAHGISVTDPNAGAAPYGAEGYAAIEAYANAVDLPVGWAVTTLQGTDVMGAASYEADTNGTWMLAGGSGISSMSPIGQFLSQPWRVASGAVIHATVVKIASDGNEAAAGLLAVNQLSNPSGGFVLLSVRKNGTVTLSWSCGDSVNYDSIDGDHLPLMLAISQCAGNGISASFSNNGGAFWQSIGDTPVPFCRELLHAGIMSTGGVPNATLADKRGSVAVATFTAVSTDVPV